MSTATVAPSVQVLTADQAVGITVNQHRFARNMTTTELAMLLGLSQASVSRKLHGRVGWSLKELVIISNAFEVSLSDIAPTQDEWGNWIPASFTLPTRRRRIDENSVNEWAHRESNPEPAD